MPSACVAPNASPASAMPISVPETGLSRPTSDTAAAGSRRSRGTTPRRRGSCRPARGREAADGRCVQRRRGALDEQGDRQQDQPPATSCHAVKVSRSTGAASA